MFHPDVAIRDAVCDGHRRERVADRCRPGSSLAAGTESLGHLRHPTPKTRDSTTSAGTLAVPTVGATTTILGIIRYAQPADFPDRGVLAPDRTVFRGDFAAGLQIDILNARDGDTWTWEFVDPSGAVVATSTLRFLASFLGQADCFTFGLLGPTLCGDTGITAESATLRVHCGVPGAWKINLSYNATLLSAEQFTLISTGARADVTLDPPLITPRVRGGGGIPNIVPGVTTVTVRVSDSGCPNLPIPGVAVTLDSETVPGSGGHAHLGTRIGTGKFSAESGTTDRNGLLTGITYTAGLVGLEENIIATPAGQSASPGTARLTIAVQAAGITLLPLAQSPSLYEQRQSAGAKQLHPMNNYGTPDVVLRRIPMIAEQFLRERQSATGKTSVVSINDISLPSGGVFDINGALENDTLHVSHEIGVDFDVNSTDSTLTPLTGKELKALRELAEGSVGGCRYIHAIHFRCDRPLLLR